jgi:hypothetical protein
MKLVPELPGVAGSPSTGNEITRRADLVRATSVPKSRRWPCRWFHSRLHDALAAGETERAERLRAARLPATELRMPPACPNTIEVPLLVW